MGGPVWSGATATRVRALHNEYSKIFRHGNRNAASHLWTSFLVDRSPQMTPQQLEFMFSGFCAVPGSPVTPSDYNRYRLTLNHVNGDVYSGFMHYCCWPCVCDTQDFIKVDTKTIETGEGSKEYHFAVIGNPCDHQEKLTEPFEQPFRFGGTTTLQREAAELRCSEDGTLLGATMSDHGFVIISMFFDAELVDESKGLVTTADSVNQPGRISTRNGVSFQDEHEYDSMCTDRAANGYNSGMGEIFRKAAGVSPITVPMVTCANGAETGSAPDGTVSSCVNNETGEGEA